MPTPNQPIERFRGYPVLHRQIQLAGHTYELLGPANYEALIDDPRVAVRFEQDEYLPYWAEFWPANRALAELVAGWLAVGPDESPPIVLEVGCGLGLASLVAAHRGYRTIASDYDDDALAFVAESARRSGLNVATRFVDWRETYPDLAADRILAGEVLYEVRNLQPVAEFIRRHLRPGGVALLCDAFRTPADGFPAVAQACGFSIAISTSRQPGPAADKPLSVRIFELRVA